MKTKKTKLVKGGIILLMTVILAACAQEEMSLVDTPDVEVDARLEQVLSIAERMIGSLEGEEPTRSVRTLTTLTRLDGTRTDDEGGVYIANYGYGDGFALVSTRPNSIGVMGFSDTGSLNLQDTAVNGGLKDYLDAVVMSAAPGGYTKIDSLKIINPGTGLVPLPPVEPSVYKIEVAPILTYYMSRWHQSYPYNSMCPLDNEGNRTLVGCGPLAISMMMAHYEWPESDGAMTFNWSKIRNTYGCDQLYYLVRTVGIKASAKYGATGTGVTTDNMCEAFKKFGYKKPSTVSFSEATGEVWNGNPILVIGTNKDPDKNSAHAWIVDGIYSRYEPGLWWTSPAPTLYYYHTVWGWGGTSNGYFSYSGGEVSGKPYKTGENDSNISIGVGYDSFRVISGLKH